MKKNILGDIIAVYNTLGTLIGNYQYDAWGNILNLATVNNNSILQSNPFRYRGYFYDTETDFYYLQSRYYDPAVGRFLNADEPSMLYETASTVGGANLYAYCLNNPVMMIDPSGYGPFADFFTGLWNGFKGAVVGAWNAITNPVATFNAIINDPLGAIWGMAHFSLQIMNPMLLYVEAGLAYSSGGASGLGSYIGGYYGDAAIMAASYGIGYGLGSVGKFLFNNKILKVGKMTGTNAKAGYFGVRYQNNKTGVIKSLELHPNHKGMTKRHGAHLQKNTWTINGQGQFKRVTTKGVTKHFSIFMPWKGWW